MDGPTAIKTQLLQTHTHTHTKGTFLEHLPQVIRENVPLRPTRHLLHKATIPRLGGIADPSNTQKQIQRGSQMGR